MSTPIWTARKDAARAATMAYLKSGRSKWIDIALDEGWSSILRDWVQHSIYEHARVEGHLPSLARVDQIFSVVNEYDHKAAVGSRVALNAEIEREILVARGRADKAPFVPTEQLVAQMKQAKLDRELSMRGGPQVELADVSRPAFEAMQRNSPNKGMHGGPALTERSRRMQGDGA